MSSSKIEFKLFCKRNENDAKKYLKIISREPEELTEVKNKISFCILCSAVFVHSRKLLLFFKTLRENTLRNVKKVFG